MKLRSGIAVAMIFVGVVVADEIVSPPLLPSAMMLPLGSNLVNQNQQKHDAIALQNVTNALEKALTKSDKKQHAAEKKDQKKQLKEQKAGVADKRLYAEEKLQAAATEFLRFPEFARPITIKTKKISLRDALFVLAKQAGINLLIDHDIKGDLPSLRAELAPVSAVIQMVLDAHRPPLALIRVAGAWRVVLRSRAEELMRSIIQADASADRVSGRIVIKQATWDDRLKNSIQELWRGVVGEGNDKNETYLVIDDTANQLLFSARAAHVKKFKELIYSIDQATPQIRLEMRVIIANKNFESDFGLQWSGLYDRRYWAGKFGLAGIGLGATTPANYTPNPVLAAGVLPSLNPISTAVGAAPDIFSNMLGWVLNAIPVSLSGKTKDALSMSFPITFGGRNLEWGRLNLQLMAAEQNMEIKTILKPTLLVNNLETAEILVGQQLPHKVGVQEAVQGNLVNAQSTAYKDVGTKIQVKPVAMHAAGQVALDIFLEHSYVVSLQQTSGNDDRGTYKYSLETARTRNKVVLKSGQTTMIGGLMVNSYEQVESGIPFLKDIPLLGLLFKGRSKVMIDKQLLIFITPTIVDSGSAVEPTAGRELLNDREEI